MELVDGKLEISGGSSFNLDTTKLDFDFNVPESSLSVGKTVFEYMALHPQMSNPKRKHRYLLSIFKQPPSFQLNKDSIGTGTDDYSSRRIGSTLKFQTLNNLELLGVAYFSSSYTSQTSSIFTALGLHEPVYSKIIGSPRKLVEKIQKTTLGPQEFKQFPKIPTVNEQQAAKMNTDKFEVKKGGKIGVLEKVAMVKNKKDDLANKFKGELTKLVTKRKNRYEYS